MRLVDDQRVVAAQLPVPLQLGEQDAVGHDAQQRAGGDPIGEADGVPDAPAEWRAELLGDPFGDRSGGDPPWLRVADETLHAAPELQAHLRELGALPRAGLPGDDDHLVVPDGRQELFTAGRDRQRLGIAQAPSPDDRRPRRLAGIDTAGRTLHAARPYRRHRIWARRFSNSGTSAPRSSVENVRRCTGQIGRMASAGSRRAARIAGDTPASRPTASARPTPAASAPTGTSTSQPWAAGVHGRHDRAEEHTGEPAEEGQDAGFHEELPGDVTAPSTERPPHADLAPPLEHGDHHHVRDPDAADDEGDGAEPEQQVAQRGVGRGAGGQGIGRSRHVDLVRRLGVDAPGQHGPHLLDLVGHRADVQRRRRAGRLEQLVGDRVADQCGGVEVGGQRCGFDDADHREPLRRPARPDAVADVIDAQAGAAASAPSTTVGSRADAASRNRPSASSAADDLEHRRVGGGDKDAAGDGLVDEVVAADRRVDRRDASGIGDRADAGSRVAGRLGQVSLTRRTRCGPAPPAAGRCRGRRAGR